MRSGLSTRRRRSSGSVRASWRPRPAREERDAERDRREDEGALDPEVGADVVVADREHEADRRERERRRAAERALEQDGAGDGPPLPGWRRDVSKIRIASPPIEVGSTCPAVYEV